MSDLPDFARAEALAPDSVASPLANYQHTTGLDDAALAAQLHCSLDELARLRRCSLPRPDHFDEDVQQMAEQVHADAAALAPLLRAAGVPAHPTGSSRLPLVMAWGAMLLASDLSPILWKSLLGWKEVPFWDSSARGLCLAVLLALTWLWSRLRPLRGFLWALLAAHLGLIPVIAILAFPQVSSLPPSLFIFVNALLLAAIAGGLMTLTLIGSGVSRRDLFLARGNMRAPSRMLAFIRLPIRWTRLGPLLIVLTTLPLALQLTLTVRPDFALFQRALPALPVILSFAIINAAQEEFRFRMVFLARLAPVMGARQALLLTSVLFGVDHWFGHPSGPTGVVLAGLLGWFLGTSMLETRGIAWAWLIHGVQDVVIMTFLVMTTVLR